MLNNCASKIKIARLRNYISEKSNYQSQNAILSQCCREKSGPPQMERFTSIFLLEEIFVKKCHFRSILPNVHLWMTTQVNSTPFRKSSSISQNYWLKNRVETGNFEPNFVCNLLLREERPGRGLLQLSWLNFFE